MYISYDDIGWAGFLEADCYDQGIGVTYSYDKVQWAEAIERLTG